MNNTVFHASFRRQLAFFMKRYQKIRTVVTAVSLTSVLTSCVSPASIIGYHGVVYDSSTGRPLEGVYVMAEYLDGGGVIFGHSSTWCVRTAGTYTGADGKFSLPGSFRTTLLHPIKLGFVDDGVKTSAVRQARGGRDVGPPYDFVMTPQVPEKPEQSEYVDCGRAEKLDDVLANIEYLKILGAEDRKYRGDSEIVDRAILRLQRTEGNPAAEKPASR